MPISICKNCGEPNIFTAGVIPEKVKCDHCGNTYRTAGTVSGAAVYRPDPREQAALEEIRAIRREQEGGGDVVTGVLYLISVVIAFFILVNFKYSYVAAALMAIVWPFVLAYFIFFT